MDLESEARSARFEYKLQQAMEMDAARDKANQEAHDKEYARPEWGGELAAAIARRGVASATMLSFRGMENVDRHTIPNEAYTRPSQKREGWIIDWKEAPRLDLHNPRISLRKGFALSTDGDVWHKYRERLWMPALADGVPVINHGRPTIDEDGRQWLKAHSLKAEQTFGIFEDSYYSESDRKIDERESKPMVSALEIIGQIAVSVIVTIDLKPEKVQGNIISIDKAIIQNNDLLSDYIAHKNSRLRTPTRRV